MRISDWSSDVCSSDLLQQGLQIPLAEVDVVFRREQLVAAALAAQRAVAGHRAGGIRHQLHQAGGTDRAHGTRIAGAFLAHEGEDQRAVDDIRSEEQTSELESLMRLSYAVFCLKKKKQEQEKSTQKTENN